MKPNEPNGYNQPLAPSAGDVHQEAQMPLGIGGFESSNAGEDVLGGDGGRKKANTGALLLVAVVIVGGGGLFAMKKLASASASVPLDPKIEEVIGRFLDNPDPAVAGADPLDVIDSNRTNQQVPLENVQRDPFVVFEDLVIVADPTQVEDPLDIQSRRWQRERDQKRETLEKAAQSFQLESVMMGSSPLAIVSKKIVRQGDTIRSPRDDVTFTVESIAASSVIVRTVNEEYDLEVNVTLVLDRN